MSSSLTASPKRVLKKKSDNGPETVSESVPITPPRSGRKAKVTTTPTRVTDEDRKGTDLELLVKSAKDTFDQIPSSPSKAKSPRSYIAPVSPGKSPTKRSDTNASSVIVSSDDEEDKKAPISPTKLLKKSPGVPVISPSPAGEVGSPFHGQKIKISPRAEKAYSIVRVCTGTLGGNGTTGAIYGELTIGSMQRVINIMIDKCGLNSQSRFIDVGSGLGKPNLHASQDPQVRLSVGIELEKIRWHLAMYNLTSILEVTQQGKPVGETPESVTRDTPLLGGTNFMVGDIDDASSTDPFTHIYMYDLGFPPPLQQSIARKFNNSQYAQYLVSYRPPRRVIEEYGYEVELVDQITTSMHGSGEGHMAYFYRRTNQPPKLTSAERARLKSLSLPARTGFNEKTESVLCDPAFVHCAQLAVGDVAELAAYASEVVDNSLLSSERPKRERRPVRLFDA